jgi:ABC-2 type transport system permease protein
MRLLSTEQSSGTVELLMTLPLRDGEVVVGKYLAGLVAYLPTLAFTTIFVVFIVIYGNPDPGVLFAAYLGHLLYVSALLGLGTLASAMSNNQLAAWLIGFVLALALYIIDFPGQIGVLGETAATVLRELSFRLHLENFMRGLITARDVAYYVLVTAVSLFAATRVMESRRWR